jgi:hypothetical protein
MKKYLSLFYFLFIGFSSIASSPGNIDEKLVQTFRESYPNAIEVNWKEFPQAFAVYFAEEKVRANIIFKKDGSFVSSTRYYGEEYLPYYLVASIKSKFPEKKIYGVTEISSPSDIAYYIKLEDEGTWMTIKLDSDGSLKVIEKFRKDQ